MWLSHHEPDAYDHCVLVGERYVCRRCLVLYPLAFAVALLTASWHPGDVVDTLLIALLPLPAVVELVLEQLRVVRYDARRQVLVTVPLAIGLGRGFAVYLGDQASLRFWIPVVLYTVVCLSAIAWNRLGPGRADEAR